MKSLASIQLRAKDLDEFTKNFKLIIQLPRNPSFSNSIWVWQSQFHSLQQMLSTRWPEGFKNTTKWNKTITWRRWKATADGFGWAVPFACLRPERYKVGCPCNVCNTPIIPRCSLWYTNMDILLSSANPSSWRDLVNKSPCLVNGSSHAALTIRSTSCWTFQSKLITQQWP